MKVKERVHARQMASLFLAYMTGSAIINIPTPLAANAQNAAWLSMLMANGLGMLLLACVLYMYRKFPELTFVDYSRKLVGKVVTFLFVVPFLITVFIMLANIVSDIGGFFKSTTMRETPSYMFYSMTLLVASVTARAGIEVMARLFTFLVALLYMLSLAVLLFALHAYDTTRLFPIFPQGIKPMFHGAYFAWGFPNAELVLFTMLLPFVNKGQERLAKRMYTMLLINGAVLTIVIICTLMSLGSMAGVYKFSLFALSRLIEIRDFVERIEAVPGMMLIAGSYLKATIVLLVISLMMAQLLNIPNYRILVFPIAFVSFMLSLTMFNQEVEFGEFVGNVWPLLITLTGVLPLLLLALVAAFKGEKNGMSGEGAASGGTAAANAGGVQPGNGGSRKEAGQATGNTESQSNGSDKSRASSADNKPDEKVGAETEGQTALGMPGNPSGGSTGSNEAGSTAERANPSLQ